MDILSISHVLDLEKSFPGLVSIFTMEVNNGNNPTIWRKS